MIFISHSVGPKELVLVNVIAEESARRNVTPTIPDRNWQPNRIPMRIRRQIEDSDYLIGIATDNGHHSQWLNTEVIYSQRLSPPKPVLLVTDASTQVGPTYDRIIINRRNPLSTISEISHRIQRLTQDRNTQNLLTGILIGGITLLLLYSSKED